MAYKCIECGNIFEYGEEAVWYEKHGLDTLPYEKRTGCPLCKGDYEKTVKCKICGAEHLEYELNGKDLDYIIRKNKLENQKIYQSIYGIV